MTEHVVYFDDQGTYPDGHRFEWLTDGEHLGHEILVCGPAKGAVPGRHFRCITCHVGMSVAGATVDMHDTYVSHQRR